jgi:hypothetical protein
LRLKHNDIKTQAIERGSINLKMKVQTTREKHTISKYRHEIQSSLHKTLTHDGNQKPSSKGKTKSIRMCSIMCDEVRNPSEREDTRNNQGPLQDLNGYKLLSMLF